MASTLSVPDSHDHVHLWLDRQAQGRLALARKHRLGQCVRVYARAMVSQSCTVAAAQITLGDLLVPGESYIGAVVHIRPSTEHSSRTPAFLPLAHILEFTVEMIMLYIGIPIGYGNIKTLTETSTRNCLGDIRTFRPTGAPAEPGPIFQALILRSHGRRSRRMGAHP
jgi:hypothetical protein